MASDIRAIVNEMRCHHPDVAVQQLQVSHPGDDDGIWFFRRADSQIEVQLESSSGNCPFLIESTEHDHRISVGTADEALCVLEHWLHLPIGPA